MNAYGPGALHLLKESAMPKDKKGHGIVLDEKGQEQPADKERARTANKTQPGHMPAQPKHEGGSPQKRTSESS
jgi:hypothetical protein